VNDERRAAERAAAGAVSGEGAHVEVRHVFAGLDWKLAGRRPEGAPHSVYQLLNHVVYWHEWVLRWLDGKRPAVPRHASGSWPGSAAPRDRAAWEAVVRRLGRALDGLERRAHAADLLAKRGEKTGLEMLQTIGSHASWHAGQAALVRQMLGAWPPPAGPLTW
jgi:uncharacterized damage-inducible protein DinB